jgi:hypothetical protein
LHILFPDFDKSVYPISDGGQYLTYGNMADAKVGSLTGLQLHNTDGTLADDLSKNTTPVLPQQTRKESMIYFRYEIRTPGTYHLVLIGKASNGATCRYKSLDVVLK